jgi:DNA-binding transcriptional MerR regulator
MHLEKPLLLADKTYFSITEVSKATSIKTHVLRYWESQFAFLHPDKSKGNRRLYRREDIDKILLIKDLLYRQKFSIAGAKKHINLLKKQGAFKEALRPDVLLNDKQIEALVALRNSLLEFKNQII